MHEQSGPSDDPVQRWAQGPLADALERFPETRERFRNDSNREIKRLYLPRDGIDAAYLKQLGLPGEYPFTRGVQATMYRGRLWTVRQYAGFGTAETTNQRLSSPLKNPVDNRLRFAQWLQSAMLV